MKFISLFVCLLTLVFYTQGLEQLRSALVNSENPLLIKILESIDAATNDEHLLAITLKLLNSLCACMQETLKVKVKTYEYTKKLTDLRKDEIDDGKVLDIYKKIYNNTCFNLREELKQRNNVSGEILGHLHCGSFEKDELYKLSENVSNTKLINNLLRTKMDKFLYKSLIDTRLYHKYTIKRYYLFKKVKTQAKPYAKHSLIVIITLHPKKTNKLQNKHNFSEKDINNILLTNSTIDIDIIDTKFDQKSKESDEVMNQPIYSDCHLQSLYTFLIESEKKNLTKVFRFLKRNNTIKVYIEVFTAKNHSDFLNICCEYGSITPLCRTNLISKLKSEEDMISQYENFNDTTCRASFINKNNAKPAKTTTTTGTITINATGKSIDNETQEYYTDKHNDLVNDYTTKVTDANENNISKTERSSVSSLTLKDASRAILMLEIFVSKQSTKSNTPLFYNTTNISNQKYNSNLQFVTIRNESSSDNLIKNQLQKQDIDETMNLESKQTNMSSIISLNHSEPSGKTGHNTDEYSHKGKTYKDNITIINSTMTDVLTKSEILKDNDNTFDSNSIFLNKFISTYNENDKYIVSGELTSSIPAKIATESTMLKIYDSSHNTLSSVSAISVPYNNNILWYDLALSNINDKQELSRGSQEVKFSTNDIDVDIGHVKLNNTVDLDADDKDNEIISNEYVTEIVETLFSPPLYALEKSKKFPNNFKTKNYIFRDNSTIDFSEIVKFKRDTVDNIILELPESTNGLPFHNDDMSRASKLNRLTNITSNDAKTLNYFLANLNKSKNNILATIEMPNYVKRYISQKNISTEKKNETALKNMTLHWPPKNNETITNPTIIHNNIDFNNLINNTDEYKTNNGTQRSPRKLIVRTTAKSTPTTYKLIDYLKIINSSFTHNAYSDTSLTPAFNYTNNVIKENDTETSYNNLTTASNNTDLTCKNVSPTISYFKYNQNEKMYNKFRNTELEKTNLANLSVFDEPVTKHTTHKLNFWLGFRGSADKSKERKDTYTDENEDVHTTYPNSPYISSDFTKKEIFGDFWVSTQLTSILTNKSMLTYNKFIFHNYNPTQSSRKDITNKLNTTVTIPLNQSVTRELRSSAVGYHLKKKDREDMHKFPELKSNNSIHNSDNSSKSTIYLKYTPANDVTDYSTATNTIETKCNTKDIIIRPYLTSSKSSIVTDKLRDTNLKNTLRRPIVWTLINVPKKIEMKLNNDGVFNDVTFMSTSMIENSTQFPQIMYVKKPTENVFTKYLSNKKIQPSSPVSTKSFIFYGSSTKNESQNKDVIRKHTSNLHPETYYRYDITTPYSNLVDSDLHKRQDDYVTQDNYLKNINTHRVNSYSEIAPFISTPNTQTPNSFILLTLPPRDQNYHKSNSNLTINITVHIAKTTYALKDAKKKSTIVFLNNTFNNNIYPDVKTKTTINLDGIKTPENNIESISNAFSKNVAYAINTSTETHFKYSNIPLQNERDKSYDSITPDPHRSTFDLELTSSNYVTNVPNVTVHNSFANQNNTAVIDLSTMTYIDTSLRNKHKQRIFPNDNIIKQNISMINTSQRDSQSETNTNTLISNIDFMIDSIFYQTINAIPTVVPEFDNASTKYEKFNEVSYPAINISLSNNLILLNLTNISSIHNKLENLDLSNTVSSNLISGNTETTVSTATRITKNAKKSDKFILYEYNTNTLSNTKNKTRNINTTHNTINRFKQEHKRHRSHDRISILSLESNNQIENYRDLAYSNIDTTFKDYTKMKSLYQPEVVAPIASVTLKADKETLLEDTNVKRNNITPLLLIYQSHNTSKEPIIKSHYFLNLNNFITANPYILQPTEPFSTNTKFIATDINKHEFIDNQLPTFTSNMKKKNTKYLTFIENVSHKLNASIFHNNSTTTTENSITLQNNSYIVSNENCTTIHQENEDILNNFVKKYPIHVTTPASIKETNNNMFDMSQIETKYSVYNTLTELNKVNTHPTISDVIKRNNNIPLTTKPPDFSIIGQINDLNSYLYTHLILDLNNASTDFLHRRFDPSLEVINNTTNSLDVHTKFYNDINRNEKIVIPTFTLRPYQSKLLNANTVFVNRSKYNFKEYYKQNVTKSIFEKNITESDELKRILNKPIYSTTQAYDNFFETRYKQLNNNASTVRSFPTKILLLNKPLLKSGYHVPSHTVKQSLNKELPYLQNVNKNVSQSLTAAFTTDWKNNRASSPGTDKTNLSKSNEQWDFGQNITKLLKNYSTAYINKTNISYTHPTNDEELKVLLNSSLTKNSNVHRQQLKNNTEVFSKQIATLSTSYMSKETRTGSLKGTPLISDMLILDKFVLKPTSEAPTVKNAYTEIEEPQLNNPIIHKKMTKDFISSVNNTDPTSTASKSNLHLDYIETSTTSYLHFIQTATWPKINTYMNTSIKVLKNNATIIDSATESVKNSHTRQIVITTPSVRNSDVSTNIMIHNKSYYANRRGANIHHENELMTKIPISLMTIDHEKLLPKISTPNKNKEIKDTVVSLPILHSSNKNNISVPILQVLTNATFSLKGVSSLYNALNTTKTESNKSNLSTIKVSNFTKINQNFLKIKSSHARISRYTTLRSNLISKVYILKPNRKAVRKTKKAKQNNVKYNLKNDITTNNSIILNNSYTTDFTVKLINTLNSSGYSFTVDNKLKINHLFDDNLKFNKTSSSTNLKNVISSLLPKDSNSGNIEKNKTSDIHHRTKDNPMLTVPNKVGITTSLLKNTYSRFIEKLITKWTNSYVMREQPIKIYSSWLNNPHKLRISLHNRRNQSNHDNPVTNVKNNINFIDSSTKKYIYANNNKHPAIISKVAKPKASPLKFPELTKLFPGKGLNFVPKSKKNRKVMKKIQFGSNRRREIMTINTQQLIHNYFSRHNFGTHRNLLRLDMKQRPKNLYNKPITSIPKLSLLRPKFDTIDFVSPRFARPSDLFARRGNEEVFQNGYTHHHANGINWEQKIEELQEDKNEKQLYFDHVLDRPYVHTKKNWNPQSLMHKDTENSIKDIVYKTDTIRTINQNYDTSFQKPIDLSDDLLYFRKFLDKKYNKPVTRTTKRETVGTTRRKRRTIFFLSPTSSYSFENFG